jgi:TonB family protein
MQSGDTIEMNIVLEPATDLPEIEVTGYQRATKYGGPIPRSVNSIPEQTPQFRGGEAALKKYIESHIQYPANAILNKIEGEVLIQFIVKTTGEIGTVNVIRSVDKDIDEEAVRVVKSLPAFIPGCRNGKPMVMWYTMPVVFKLPKENND